MHDVMELFDYWNDYPPVHWLLRAYVGYEPPRKFDDMEAREALKMLTPSRTAKKLSGASERVRRMAESVKAQKNAG